MRTAYTSRQLVPDEIAWSSGAADSLYLPDPQITRSISIGADFREMYVGSNRSLHNLDFFQMQGDLYLAFQLDAKVALYVDHGMSNSHELFGIAYVLPWTGYVKAGRFVPSYGWKFDDHTMVVRGDLGFAPPSNSDAGAELGLQPGPFDLQLGLSNGNRGSTLDNDRDLAESFNATYRLRAAGINAAAGGQGWHQRTPQVTLDVGGVRGYASVRGVTWLGEADLARTTQRASGARTTGLATSHEVSAVVHQGLEVVGTYDFLDPDRHLRSGARSRWGIGVQLMPRSYAAIGAAFRATHVDAGPAIPNDEFNEALVQLHLLY